MTIPSQAAGEVVLEDLSKRYGDVHAMRDVELVATPGRFVTLLGPSGSGKTTTLMAIAGFLTPDRGRILLDGIDVTALPANRRGLGMVFQHYALFPHMTVADNVAFPLSVRGRPKAEIVARVADALRMVKLEGYDGRYPKQLSGGQQQRVALARAIVFAPNVLLMDEPLGALDKNLREHMQSEIRRIHRQIGTTVFYVTHDQEEALSLSDLIVVMHDGRIEQSGSPRDLYERPRSAFVATFIGGANVLHGEVLGADGEATVVRHISGQTFAARLEGDPRPGSQVALSVRPERLRLLGQPNATAPLAKLDGTLGDVTYLGSTVRVEVVVGDETVTVTLNDPHDLCLPERGAPIGVGWDMAACVHLVDEKG